MSQKTVTRDLNELQEMRLVIRMRSGVMSAMEQLRSFIPLRANEPEGRQQFAQPAPVPDEP